MNKGRIIKIISNLYTVLVDNELYQCRCSGKIRNLNISPVVGDLCLINIDKCYIESILDRKNYLNRPYISNVDECLVVTSLKEPDLSLYLLDKQISYLIINKIHPTIILTKRDLISDEDYMLLSDTFKYYESIGIKVFFNTEVNKINEYLDNKLVVVTGQTGAGKSSLINKLGNYNIETNEISHALGRGKHTTRHVEIYKINNFSIADTPGFSALDLNIINKEELRDSFIEFSNYQCRFNDCMHNKEIDCGVKNQVGIKILKSRYDNYIKMLEEIKKG